MFTFQYFRETLIRRARKEADRMKKHFLPESGNAFFPQPLRYVAVSGRWVEFVNDTAIQSLFRDLCKRTNVSVSSPRMQCAIIDEYVRDNLYPATMTSAPHARLNDNCRNAEHPDRKLGA